MVLISVVCPYCSSEKVRKNGRYPNGKQRYLCDNEECSHKTFILEYTYNGNNPKVREAVYEHIVNGTGTRATARLLKISRNTVTALLKKKNLPSLR